MPAGRRTRHRAGGPPRAVVGDLQLRSGRGVAQPHLRAGLRAGVLEGVGERLLHDPVDGQPGAGTPGARGALAGQLDPDARGADLVDQLVEVVQARLGDQLERGLRRLAVAEQAEQSPHFRQRLPPRPRDLLHRVRGPVGRRGGGEGRAVGQGDHDGQVVRDDVVQLPGDAGALGGDRELGLLVAFALQPPGALLQLRQVGLPRADGQSEQDGCGQRAGAQR